MKPLILIPANIEEHSGPKVVLNPSAAQALRRAGGVPLAVPLTEDLSEMSDLLDGAGGVFMPYGFNDVAPLTFGAEPAPHLGQIRPELDEFQIAFFRLAMERKLPALGVCRGAQVMAVAMGGTILQHIPTSAPYIQHCPKIDPRYGAHSVLAEKGSRIESLLGPKFSVNSLHHQAVETPGQHMVVSGRSPDGVAEVIEHEDRSRFVLGVQWHPEDLHSHSVIFDAFMEAVLQAR